MKYNVKIVPCEQNLESIYRNFVSIYRCESCGKIISENDFLESIDEFDFHLCKGCQERAREYLREGE